MSEHGPHYRLNQMSVLVVDDNPTTLTQLGELLSPYYQVRIASNGRRALEMVESGNVPDIILLDIMMPGMDGYTFLRTLRNNPEHRDIPVIFVTAIDENQNEETGLALGAVDFLHKPVNPALLLARMKLYLTIMAERNALVREIEFLHQEIAKHVAENGELKAAGQEALSAIETALTARGHSDPVEDLESNTFPVPIALDSSGQGWKAHRHGGSPLPR